MTGTRTGTAPSTTRTQSGKKNLNSHNFPPRYVTIDENLQLPLPRSRHHGPGGCAGRAEEDRGGEEAAGRKDTEGQGFRREMMNEDKFQAN